MKSISSQKQAKRERRHARIRSKVAGTDARPRLSVFKSNKYLWAQLINDDSQVTIVSATTKGAAGKTETERAHAAGMAIAKAAKAKGISAVVFDRGGFIYTGRVRAFADGAREGGLTF